MASFAGENKPDFKVKSFVEFYRTANNSFRAEVCEIGDYPYVAIAKFWKPDNQEDFIPTKKNIFLSLAQWNALGLKAKDVNSQLSKFGYTCMLFN